VAKDSLDFDCTLLLPNQHFSKGALSSLFLVFGMLDEKGRVFEE
jgi:hypothetical protein